ncbi:hypothetical protein K1T71_002252 [Dendrolimus kikuchii]|uniref:Uncharacterized protein n=1 Tax=Dendrolimus kikuchii TaxID=765133 RepID=A0ACC1DCF4_9NEOP|nr:hypothetical protein K1T71_002252 [Dendrolimus kikuchii]
MDPNVIECDLAERDPGLCVGKEGPTLDILNEVQRAYEERLRRIDQIGGSKRLQSYMFVPFAVETLGPWGPEAISTKIYRNDSLTLRVIRGLVLTSANGSRKRSQPSGHLTHRRRDTKNMCGKVNELKTLNESLMKENSAKDREIRKLNKDMQQYEQTILGLRKEISFANYQTPDISKKDAEVMAGMCCSGAEGDWQPVKDYNAVLREEVLRYQERIQKMEETLKSSGESVRALRKMNVSLSEEAHAVRRVCVALDEQCRAATMRANFKDDIIKEMRRQLKQAKAKNSRHRSCVIGTNNRALEVRKTSNVGTRVSVEFGRWSFGPDAPHGGQRGRRGGDEGGRGRRGGRAAAHLIHLRTTHYIFILF